MRVVVMAMPAGISWGLFVRIKAGSVTVEQLCASVLKNTFTPRPSVHSLLRSQRWIESLGTTDGVIIERRDKEMVPPLRRQGATT